MKNVITEEQMLRGKAAIQVETRSGELKTVNCNSLNWAAACHVMNLTQPGEAMIHTVMNGAVIEGDKDEFLNALPPAALSEIASTVLLLTNGLPALKKEQAARKQTAPAMPISTPPPVNSAATVSPVPSVPGSAPIS